jgi:hypothetical protein
MLTSAIFILAVAGLAATAPTARQAPNYPPASSSNAFRLVVNVTDPSTDFIPSINDFVLTSYHTGAGQAYAVVAPNLSAATGRILYENGTAIDISLGGSTIISDSGTPPFPSSIIVQDVTQFDPRYPTQHNVQLNVGEGTKNVGLARFPEPIPALQGPAIGTFAVCSNVLSSGQAFVLTYAYATFEDANGNYLYQKNIPEGCAEIKLLPQCATINELPANAYSSHEFASIQKCYDDVAVIDWTVYSA